MTKQGISGRVVAVSISDRKGIKKQNVDSAALVTHDHPYHVRFIELMPFQSRNRCDYNDRFMPIREFIKKIPQINRARVGPIFDTGGPARLCTLPGAMGKVGFIAPLSWHFCGSCNRLRLTADGKIRNCLFSDEEIDIKHPLRNGGSKMELVRIFRRAVEHKPRRHHLGSAEICRQQRSMRAIGG